MKDPILANVIAEDVVHGTRCVQDQCKKEVRGRLLLPPQQMSGDEVDDSAPRQASKWW